MALEGDGTVWAWGRRDNGEIGDGEPKGLRAERAIGPTRVPGERITQIAVDGSHNLALRSDGRGMTWGLNRNGELGIGTRSHAHRAGRAAATRSCAGDWRWQVGEAGLWSPAPAASRTF